MKPIVFAGPSLYGVPATAVTEVAIAPPAGCGDLMRAADNGYRAIGLVDGTFESGPAVWHKEILYALSLGCRVLGAASMGALRAVECEPFGMIGAGEVFDDYRSGRRVSDSDVALTYGPAELGYPPTSLALVDAEDGLDRFVVAGLLSSAAHDRLAAHARSLFFKDRTWQHMFELAGIADPEARICVDWLDASGPSLKSRDAMQLVEMLVAGQQLQSAHYVFESTLFFDQLHQPS